jgi:hypothetical protein
VIVIPPSRLRRNDDHCFFTEKIRSFTRHEVREFEGENMNTFILRFMVLGLFAASFSTAFAQWSSNTALNTPLCTSGKNQRKPKMMHDGNGGTISVWEDERSSVKSLYAQKLDSAGIPQWTIDGVTVGPSGGIQFDAQIISDMRGGAIIAWTGAGGGNNDVFVQRLDADGNKKWGSQGAQLTSALTMEDGQRICTDGKGGVILVWQSYIAGNHTGIDDIYAQYVDSTGNEQWQTDGMPITVADLAQYSPAICSDGQGGAIIVWQDGRNNNLYDIYGQRVGPFGGTMWPTDGLQITNTMAESYPIVCMDGAGGAFLVWQHLSSGTDIDLQALRIDPDGNLIWSGPASVCVAADKQLGESLDYIGSNTAVVAWEDYRNGGINSSDIYAQKLDQNGIAWQMNGVPVCTKTDFQVRCSVSADGAGGAYVLWTDRRAGGDYTKVDLYGQRLSSTGAPVWTADGIPVCTAASEQNYPLVVGIPGIGMVGIWEDSRSGVANVNLYVQRILLDGKLPPAPPPLFVGTPKTLNFPSVKIGNKSDLVTTLSNSGGDTLKITAVSSSNPVFVSLLKSKAIAPGATAKDTIRFSPTATGPFDGFILFTTNTRNGIDTIYVHGSGLGSPAVALSSKNIAFGKIPKNSSVDSMLTLTNSGSDTLKITKVTCSNAAFYTSLVPKSILPGEFTKDTVRFKPGFVGQVSAVIVVTTNAQITTDTVKLSGEAQGGGFMSLAITEIKFGSIELGKSIDTTFTITNGSTIPGDNLYLISILSDNAAFQVKNSSDTLAPNESLTDTVRFIPSVVGSGSGIITILSTSESSPDFVNVSGTATPTVSVERIGGMAPRFSLGQNYPNPFNRETIIPFDVVSRANITVRLFSVLGTVCETLHSEYMEPGSYTIRWQPHNILPGIYFYQITNGDQTITKKLAVTE